MYRVAIVDDEPFMLEGMRLMIDWEKHGFYVCGEAANAQEALHLIDAFKPHLLITDVRMPGMMGTDLAGIVHHYHPQTIVLFYSGYRDFAFAQSAIRSQAFGYLVKPIDKDEVHKTLEAVKAELDARITDQAEGERMPVLRDHVMRRIANGDTGEECLLRAGVLLDIKRGEPCYCAVITLPQKALPEGALLMIANYGGVPFLLSANQCGLCLKQFDRDFAKLQSLQKLLEQSFGVAAQISVGSVGRGAEGFGRSLCEALDAMGVLFEPHGALRMYRPMDAAVSNWMALAAPSALVEALIKGRGEELQELMNRLRAVVKERQPALFFLRYMAKTVETMLLLGRPESGRPPQGAQNLRALWSEQAMGQEEWMNAFCGAIMSYQTAGENEGGYPAPVRAVLDTLDKEYDKALSISGIAAELHMNPAYLGQLILRTTGKAFHTLLLDTRVNHACRLLRQTSHPVGEIAFAVGFRDVDYFSRQFRARMSMSPNAYRGLDGGKEEDG